MKLTIAYMTNRPDPAFRWFADSLANQITPDLEIEVLVVDLLSDYAPQERMQYFRDHTRPEFILRVIPPKPCAWQGKHRKTVEDMFAAAIARNTAFIHTTSNYIFCVDDLTVLGPQWLANAKHAAENRYVMCGAYKKLECHPDELKNFKDGELPHMRVENGTIISHGREILDCRWNYGSDDGIKPCAGSFFFGCSFGVPMEAVLKTNGFDEYHDGLGAEDYDFGTRLARAGYKLYYNRNALTCESEEMHRQPGNFLRKNRMSHTGEEVDWYMVHRLNEQPSRFTTLGDWTNIKKLRALVASGREIPPTVIPTQDWATKKPFSEIPPKPVDKY